MARRSFFLAMLFLATACVTASAGPALPEKRPGDVRIEFSYGGGKLGDSTALVVSAGGGRFEAHLRGKTTESVDFPVSAADLDALWSVLRANSFGELETEKGIVYDKGGETLSVHGEGVDVSFGTSGANVAEKWVAKWAAIVQAFERYQRRVVDECRVPFLLVADERLAGKEYYVRLGGNMALTRQKGSWGLPVARALLHLLPGPYQLDVEVGGARAPIAFTVPATHGLQLSLEGGKVVGKPLQETPGVMKIDAAECRKRGLPAVTIDLDATAGGFVRAPDPGARSYLQLSGPPGGPLGLSIEAYSDVESTEAALEKLAAKRFDGQKYVAKTTETLWLSGGNRLAFTCSTGESLAHSVHLLVLIPSAEKATSGVLVDFFVGQGSGETLTPGQVIKLEPWGDLVKSVHVRFEP